MDNLIPEKVFSVYTLCLMLLCERSLFCYLFTCYEPLAVDFFDCHDGVLSDFSSLHNFVGVLCEHVAKQVIEHLNGLLAFFLIELSKICFVLFHVLLCHLLDVFGEIDVFDFSRIIAIGR